MEKLFEHTKILLTEVENFSTGNHSEEGLRVASKSNKQEVELNYSELSRFLSGQIPVNIFLKNIKNEVNTYKKNYAKSGSSVPIILEGNISSFTVGKETIFKLCNLYISSTISKWHIYYICDALLLSDNTIFLNEKTKETIESMTDPEINGELTQDRAKKILTTLY